jgi:hypothetical protein
VEVLAAPESTTVIGALLVQLRQYAHGHALKRIREVVHDVPPICHLH